MIPDHLTVRALKGDDLDAALDDIARLRISVFRDWPYLYDGTQAFERSYLSSYRANPEALLVAAFDGKTLIGASTSTRMEDHAEAFATPFKPVGIALTQIVYGPESAVLPPYRGLGLGHRFFELREAHARRLGRTHVAFAAVRRPDTHPARPATFRSNDAFWTAQGYAPLPGVVAEFGWKDLGDKVESAKLLQFWMRQL